MTSADVCARIRADSRFADLVGRRQRLAWLLSSIVLICHFTFILVVGFSPRLLARPLSPANAISVGLPLGMVMVLFYWLLTGVYIRSANRHFDALSADIVRRALR